MEFSRISKRIPFPNRDIEKRVAFSGIIYLLPRFDCALVRLVVTSLGIIQYIRYISTPNRDIEKRVAFSGIFNLLPRFNYALVQLVVTSLGIIQYIRYISTPNRDIEKMIAFSGIFNLSSKSPKWSPRSGVPERPMPVTPCLPL
ncbi:hypothetical protein AVEN_257347-1 [Araneus ventricosus]|uniref:Uncharacterized protein n=1 Tax=Araneus ventricosus TaxID=182803 RepID=A0A4Y2CBZ3_ARAVE|nr:hypothetical protein AVEN_257347-1 [Araneus ventricosus]